VVIGGIGSIVIAITWSLLFPTLRQQRAIDRRMA
jgi:hypothetical protein